MAIAVRARERGVQFAVRVQPGAKREGVTGVYDDPVHGSMVKIALSAPAIDGRANDALTAFLAKLLGVPKCSLAIVGGTTSRSKVVRAFGVTPEQASILIPNRELP